MKIVELGIRDTPDNLITFAKAFPHAHIYGIEKDTGVMLYNRLWLERFPEYNSRITLIHDDYTTYVGPLQNQADITVALAPDVNAKKIADGIRNFAKPGGQVEVVTDMIPIRDNLMNEFADKNPKSRSLEIKPLPNNRYEVSKTSIGVDLVSQFTVKVAAEVYIRSW